MKRVLLVDDDQSLTDSILRSARRRASDIDFVVAHDADAAIGLLSSRFDCLVVDLKLRGTLDGFRVLDARKQRQALIPAIVISGHIDATTAPAVQHLGAAILPKIFNVETLVDMIRNPPPSAFPVTRERVLATLQTLGTTYDEARALPSQLVAQIYGECQSISATARTLDTNRQTIQDVLKRQIPRDSS